MRSGSELLFTTTLVLAISLCTPFQGVAAEKQPAPVTDTPQEIAAANDRPEVRGGFLYRKYCVLCHGDSGDGVGRGKKVWGVNRLALPLPPSYVEQIIRFGGQFTGRNPAMPPYEGEFTPQQVKDIVTYINEIQNPVKRGEFIFMANCILCHGVKARGNGRASKLYNPKPADLTHSLKDDNYKREIITKGGKAMGRSDVMPEWGRELNESQINDVVAYLRTVLIINAPQ